MLLINKFRNKFHVNSVNESEIDQLIKDEVSFLVNSDAMVEKRLTQLDKKLEVIISESRKNPGQKVKSSAMASPVYTPQDPQM